MVRIESFADVEDYVQEAIAKLAQSLETRFGAEIQGARGAMEAAVKKELQDQASARIDLESRLAGTQQALEDAVRTLGEIQGGLMPMLEPRLFQIEQLHRGLEKRVQTTEAATAEAAKAGAAAPETSPGPASPVKEDQARSPNAVGPQRFPMGSPTEVPWPTPEEVAAEAAAKRASSSPARGLGSTFDRAASEFAPTKVSEAEKELAKNVWDRKGFDKRISKYTNEKGPQEFKDWCFQLRRLVKSDPNFQDVLQHLEEMKDEVSEESLQKLKNEKGWEVAKMNEQLYGIMAEASDGRAKGSIMGREHETDTNGAVLYREFALQHLDGMQHATVALGQRLTKPPRALLE